MLILGFSPELSGKSFTQFGKYPLIDCSYFYKRMFHRMSLKEFPRTWNNFLENELKYEFNPYYIMIQILSIRVEKSLPE